MRKKKVKFNPELLNEEIKKFKILNEYNFYIDERFYEDDEATPSDDLLLGNDELSEAGDEELDAAIDDVADEASGDEGEAEVDANAEDLGDEDLGDEELEMDDEDLGDEGEPDLDMADEEPAEDEVEIDVTELVKAAEKAQQSSDMVNTKMSDLLNQFDELENQLNRVNNLASKIDDLENEMEKRMPTPEEKLEMRSLDSYPYNLKLTDYWAEKDGRYNVTDGEDENSGEPKEYVLTQNDVDSDYNEMDVKDSLEKEFEEEDI